MRLRVLCGFILLALPGMLLGAAPRSPRAQDGNKDGNRPAENKPQEQPKPQAQPRPQQQPQAQPKPQEQPRPQQQPQARPQPQAQPKPQEQPRAQQPQQPRPQAQPKPQEQPRAQEQPRPQAQPKQQQRSQDQARPQQQNNAGKQDTRPEFGNNVRNTNRPGGAPATAGATPAQRAYRPPQQSTEQRAHTQQQARSFSQASRVPQAQQRTIFQQRRGGSWQSDHRDWRARGGYQGYYIPTARFGLYFGRSHYFHLWGLPMVYVGGYPEFQYNGYWFELLDPVPDDWGPTWYQTDNVYIDWDPEDGGYYLYDTSFPNDRLAVEIDG